MNTCDDCLDGRRPYYRNFSIVCAICMVMKKETSTHWGGVAQHFSP